jgi:hypothetical protein
MKHQVFDLHALKDFDSDKRVRTLGSHRCVISGRRVALGHGHGGLERDGEVTGGR